MKAVSVPTPEPVGYAILDARGEYKWTLATLKLAEQYLCDFGQVEDGPNRPYTMEPLVLQSSLRAVEQERDATAKALGETGIGGIFDVFTSPADAITQMDQHIRELTAALRSSEERVKALTEALRWSVGYLEDGMPEQVPVHACEFTTNPARGSCEFHEEWAKARMLIGGWPCPAPEADAAETT